jgi:hypothetical protein
MTLACQHRICGVYRSARRRELFGEEAAGRQSITGRQLSIHDGMPECS